jgi:hypothetical protein
MTIGVGQDSGPVILDPITGWQQLSPLPPPPPGYTPKDSEIVGSRIVDWSFLGEINWVIIAALIAAGYVIVKNVQGSVSGGRRGRRR